MACYEIEYQLTEARQQLAERQVEAERTRGRLESQVKESGAIEQRIAQDEKESQELGRAAGRARCRRSRGHQKNVDELEAQIAQARERMTEINQQREGLQLKVRERERAIEAGRQVILRLLGEASTLKNQLAQIDEYLAGIERETARATREEQVAAAEIERLDVARKQLSETVAQRQMELESVTGERRRTRRGTGRPPQRWPPNCAARSTALKTEVSQIRARKESLEEVLAHRTYTTETVKRLFAALRKGQGRRLQAAGRAGRLRGSGRRSSKSRPKNSCTKSWNTWWWRTGSRPSAASISCAPTWMAAPRSWCIPEPNGARRAAGCPSRPSGRRPASSRGSAIRCA